MSKLVYLQLTLVRVFLLKISPFLYLCDYIVSHEVFSVSMKGIMHSYSSYNKIQLIPKNTVHVVLNTKVFESERLSNMPTVLFPFLSLVLVTTFETRGDIFNHSVLLLQLVAARNRNIQCNKIRGCVTITRDYLNCTL